ncbi:CoA transferase [Candidimonas sp. SYP-B2681]|uniref:CaiB/BaiF CoA transferase family protein n=1 Tax=Candidimonas sp. SYP-B2681 TaxID=2497686 RepID=UPI000F87BE68|nr:CoA transferase [Candidimonas sp. SYP-B2681]RTZ47461.1 CoA transferase [Candidimonas sp. SYP-B2681]
MPVQSSSPLSGIKVLDLSAYIAGPYGCSLLADLGAEVIKIEPPDGDNLRKYPSTLEAESRAFLGVNRGKTGLCVDLKKDAGYDVLVRLVQQADVLVHNFRPSVPPRLKIDYETLKRINPRLIYCSMTGYGKTGPLADKAGYDQVLQARSGICSAQGSKDQPEIVYGSAVDYYAASMVSTGVTAALYQRERTGQGQEVSVSLLGSALAMQSARLIMTEDEPKHIDRDMRSGGITGIHPTQSGHLYISANTPHFWNALCTLVGVPELARDERYDSVKKRAKHADELVPIIRRALQAKTAMQWEELFGVSVPCSAVRHVEDMFDDVQVSEQGFVVELHHPKVGHYKGIAKLIKFSGEATGVPTFGAPTLGQHSQSILRQLGYSDDQIQLALRSGAVVDGGVAVDSAAIR